VDGPGDLFTILVFAVIGSVLLSVLGMLINLFSFVRWRRPSPFGIRLRLTMAGLASMLCSSLVVVLAITNPGLSSLALWAIAALAFAFGAWVFAAGSRARAYAAESLVPASPATRAVRLLPASWLFPILGLAVWGVATLPSHPHTSVVAVSLAGTLAIFGVYAFARTTKMALRLQFGGLKGSSVLLAIAIVSLLNTLLLLTLDLPE
jgi:hypothetical protein